MVPLPTPLLLLACADVDPVTVAREPAVPGPTVMATGEVTWTAVFDDTAKADGAVDCAYTRIYEASEDRSTPWLCPGCDVVLAATITMSDEGRDCYRWVAGGEPSEDERIGWDDTRWMRAGAAFAPLGELGQRTDGGATDTVSFAGVSEAVPAPVGTVQLSIAGTFASWIEVGDAWNGMSPPPTYRCGWPVRDPPAYEGPWTVEIGRQLPDGWFRDRCDEPVRLDDFAGRYLVVDLSASDCGPCQQMASAEPAFSAEVHGLGLEVEEVTLLARSLDDPLSPADAELLASWQEAFELDSVVLGDRGWGYAMSTSVWPDSLSFPSWFVLSPAYEVLAAGQGYSSWDEMRDVIVDHWRQ